MSYLQLSTAGACVLTEWTGIAWLRRGVLDGLRCGGAARGGPYS
jgi:hypothetical protein